MPKLTKVGRKFNIYDSNIYAKTGNKVLLLYPLQFRIHDW